MFNDSKARRAIATAQDEVTQLRGQLAAAHDQLAATRDQVTVLAGQVATLRDQFGPLRSEVAMLRDQLTPVRSDVGALRGEVGVLAGRTDAHDAALGEVRARLDAFDAAAVLNRDARAQAVAARFRDDLLDHDDRIDRLGADVSRLERQAAIDLSEMRGNYAAIAEIVVRSRPGASPGTGPTDPASDR